jgi:dTDP-4-amino-4,6-dideoxygalactose transaminase
MTPLKMKINQAAKGHTKLVRPIHLSENAPDHPTPATKTAERMVIACRENVRFLNHNLKPFEKYLELPPVIDNTLYLAYTVRLSDLAPFKAKAIRQWLARKGIETRPSFGFHADPQAKYCGSAENRMREGRDKDDRSFCLPCHHHLSILDLQNVVEVLEGFFARLTQQNMGLAGEC